MQFRIIPKHSLLLAIGIAFAFFGCSKELSEQEKQANKSLELAKTSLGRGEITETRRLLNEAMASDEALGRPAPVAEELRLLGGLMRSMGQFDSATTFYDASIERYRNLADRSGVREVTMEMAAMERLNGEERKAHTRYIEALRLARVFGEAEAVRTLELAMLPSCRALDESDDERNALADLESTAGKDLQLQARAQFEIGISRMRVGATDSAVQHFRSASALAERARDTLLSLSALIRMAMVYDQAGRIAEAFQSYGDAIRGSEKVRGSQDLRFEMFTRVGNIYLRMGKGSEALRFFRAAIAVATNSGNRVAEGYAALQIGCCQMGTDNNGALKTYRSVRDLFKSLAYPPGLAYAELCMGVVLQNVGQFMEAEKHLRVAMDQQAMVSATRTPDDLYRDCERSSVNPGGETVFENLFELLVRGGKYDEAFMIAERQNSLQVQTAVDAYNPRPADEALLESLNAYFAERARCIGMERLLERVLAEPSPAKELLASLRGALDAGRNRLGQLAEETVRLNRAYEPVVRPSTTALQVVQKALGSRVAFVEYVPSRRSMYAFAVTNAGASAQMAAVSRDSIYSQCHQFLTLLRRRELRADTTERGLQQVNRRLNELTANLYTAFLRPLETAIAGNSKIIVVFGGTIPPIPLQALRRGGLPGSPYVCEQHLVTYLPLAQSLTINSPPPGAVRDVIGLGYPGSTGWDVEYELRDIRAFYKDAQLFFGQQATVAMLQGVKADLLHLAVEFRYNAVFPGNSFVTLSDGKSLTGSRRVSIGELSSLPPFPTVIVSDLADQHMTIPRSAPFVFLANHSSAFISDLYTPSRKTKKIFGETMYTALLQGNSVASAYWKSQLDMMKSSDASTPCAWASFCLWGK